MCIFCSMILSLQRVRVRYRSPTMFYQLVLGITTSATSQTTTTHQDVYVRFFSTEDQWTAPTLMFASVDNSETTSLVTFLPNNAPSKVQICARAGSISDDWTFTNVVLNGAVVFNDDNGFTLTDGACASYVIDPNLFTSFPKASGSLTIIATTSGGNNDGSVSSIFAQFQLTDDNRWVSYGAFLPQGSPADTVTTQTYYFVDGETPSKFELCIHDPTDKWKLANLVIGEDEGITIGKGTEHLDTKTPCQVYTFSSPMVLMTWAPTRSTTTPPTSMPTHSPTTPPPTKSPSISPTIHLPTTSPSIHVSPTTHLPTTSPSIPPTTTMTTHFTPPPTFSPTLPPVRSTSASPSSPTSSARLLSTSSHEITSAVKNLLSTASPTPTPTPTSTSTPRFYRLKTTTDYHCCQNQLATTNFQTVL
eukprot:m.163149 g.163149  ORF g.163149 m.163149 type:complete len:418 (+) comp31279_c5_seq3:279-1532(+)